MKHSPDSSAPRYEDFAFKGVIDKAAISATLEQRRRLYVPTGASGDEFAQEIPVYLTVPRGSNEQEITPIVRFPAWSDDYGRPAHFDAVIAEETQRPVLTPNAPGIDYSGWRRAKEDSVSHLLTPDQREELRTRSSFKKVGGAVMNACAAASKELGLPGDYYFLATSQAVAIAAGALRRARELGLSISGVALGEGVNFVNRPKLALAQQFISQNRFTNGYLDQNPSIVSREKGSLWLRRTLEAWPANGSYVRALARAGFLNDLGDISWLQEQGAQVHMERGTLSKLADGHGTQEVSQAFLDAGVSLSFEEKLGHDHPYTLTVQSYIDAVNKIA